MEKRKQVPEMNTLINEFSENTNIGRYFRAIEKYNTADSKKIYTEKYLPIIKNEEKKKGLFLSVIIRTQGKREEGLRESLLCLQAQSNQNFEIILIAHKVNNEQEKLIKDILNQQDLEFRAKIRFFKLDEGTRTTPLNFGFAHAWGEYAAVFDDDDILFDNWVESFWECAKNNRGRILHSFAFAQNWKNIEGLGYRAETAPVVNYCAEFDLLSQLTVNRCPLMTLAFPVNIFQNVGIIFNEKLNVTEDWEYFMRIAFLCGVSDVCEPTAIYRFWENIETSANLHNQEDWTETYHAIQKSFDEYHIILPPNNIKRIIKMITERNDVSFLNTDGKTLSRLYYSKGKAFDACQVISAISKKTFPEFDLWFLFEQKTNNLTALRFDLSEEGMFLMESIEIVVWFTNGEKRVVSLDECVHNGIEYKGSVLFINEDPEIVWEWSDKRMVDVVHISGAITRKVKRNTLLNRIESLFPLKKFLQKRELHKKGYF